MFQSKTASFTDGVTLAYTDTGPVPGSDNYTTLVVLHGSAFNGYGCEKLHEHCHQLNLRTIIFMRREFPGSTKYSDSEIDDLHNGRKVFIDRLCVQMAEFMKQLVDSGIPKISSDGKNGGIAIMGWSMGSATAMSLFSDVSLIPAPLYEELQLYVKDLVLDDPPYVSFGFLLPEDEKTYNPWTDPKCTTPEDSNQNLMRWASSYYDEHDMSTGHVNQLDMRSATSHNTFTNWSQADLNKYYDEAAVVRCELRM
ncbi:hypothetical protein BOTBODRAFT_118795 [Botryobasidium botryosum FD-172 SS1]|uniref:AB hydrolase-1 domain-containing protein n=1 Tax=Botryobasidium botryosum (strain FD-172 SS1) TaxID=930990 RepID=A0A067M957_BOTB1|nr:hypothetical protein BOTBODRAFT_118795 [Botryobasidium botryosum FD-172 SS1]